MRHARLGLASLGLALLATAQGHAQGKPLPPPASDAMPPVELTITMDGGKPVCAPAELRLPADTNIALHVVSTANAPVTITAPGQFENAHVLHADGDLVHVASEKGYLMKRGGQGTLRLRTLAAGDHSFACTSTADKNAPFIGKLVLVPPAG
ncbi:anaerobic typically selenocysteine-containing protein [uncultured Methylobacterium sp.]|uniref:anaerobic typically selenocysteine-containing protein n=1 Tax=uncultured Methylobacterium sp. TaxID=157278 RepID=UPI0035CC4A99